MGYKHVEDLYRLLTKGLHTKFVCVPAGFHEVKGMGITSKSPAVLGFFFLFQNTADPHRGHCLAGR